MGRKRVLALGPALSRMRFVDNGRAYEKLIQGGHDDEQQQQQQTTGRIKSSSSSSTSSSRFWAGVSWRRKKTSKKKKKKLVVEKLGNKKHERRRRLHFKVSKQLRIRLLVMSPLLLLKKLRDSYVRMILALERDCGEYGGALAMSSYPMYPMYLFA
jgi:hypothetical protein